MPLMVGRERQNGHGEAGALISPVLKKRQIISAVSMSWFRPSRGRGGPGSATSVGS